MKKLSTILSIIIICLFLSVNLFAQLASVTWNLTSNGNVSTTVGDVTGQNQSLTGMVISSYATISGSNSGNSQLSTIIGGAWLVETSQNNGRYIQFAVSPNSGKTFNVNTISLYYGAKGGSYMKANIVYSTDPNFNSSTTINGNTPLAISSSSGTMQFLSYNYPIQVNEGLTLYLRIYPWYNYVYSNKFVCLKDLVISGNTAPLPRVTTSAIISITALSAAGGGSIISEGGSSITERGICWNTSGNLSISDLRTNDGTGSGSFTSTLSGLASGVTYYVRAYATNSYGTSYGEQVSFSTLNQIIAFPGAEGYGRMTTGGRAGAVYIVTNLNDDNNPGSLRYAINQIGPRTIVFQVSGTITLTSSLVIRNDNITIAGQTAPGDGICLRNYNFAISANNVIIRFIRSRIGNTVTPVQEVDACTATSRKNNIIIDHCSFSWSVDETASFYDNPNFTLQWCMISESLNNAGHIKGNHGYGGIWGGQGATFHHNLFAHHTQRNPLFCGSRYTKLAETEIVDFVNNVIYNWGSQSSHGGADGKQNIRANYYKPGPATSSTKRNRILYPTNDPETNAGYGKFYVADNFVYGSPATTVDNWGLGVQGVSQVIKAAVKANEPYPIAPLTLQTPGEAYNSVLEYVGAFVPKRDAVDTRVISEVRTGTATYGGSSWGPGKGIIDSANDVGGWPTLNSTDPPADSDNDGMPDAWETANGLNPNNANDRNNANAEGYTMLEVYLNSLIPAGTYSLIPTKVISFSNVSSPSKFSLSQNYPNPFNPETTIKYEVPVAGNVQIKLFDILGREVTTLVDEFMHVGRYTLSLNVRTVSNVPLSSGVYFYQLRAGDFVETKKFLLMK